MNIINREEKEMKKTMFLIICVLFFGMILLGCSQQSISNEEIIHNDDVNQDNDVFDGVYGRFLLEDFYTFAATGSRDPAHYASDKLKVNDVLRVSASVDASALLKIEEIFNNKIFIIRMILKLNQ